jgi:thymidylate kinase
MLRNGLALKMPKLFHFMQFVNKYWWQLFTLPQLLKENHVLIFDRWNASYQVYGECTGVSKDSYLGGLYKYLVMPDVAIVLQTDRICSEKRDSYEQNDELQNQIKVEYAKWAAENKFVSSLVNADASASSVHKTIEAILIRDYMFNIVIDWCKSMPRKNRVKKGRWGSWSL